MSEPPATPSGDPSTSTAAAPAPKPCKICSAPAKYTCPRCSSTTCSLACVKLHKQNDTCSGVRDPAKYVPLNQFTQGTWSDDYKWLEDGRRQVAGWGQGVKVEEVEGGGNAGRGRGRGRGGPAGRGQKRSRTDGMRRELLKWGCRAEFMPEGMGRKKMNQSSWNQKSGQLHLTIHLIIPHTLLAEPTTSPSSSSKTIAHPRVLFASNDDSATLPNLSSFLPPLNTPVVELQLLLPFYSTPSHPAPAHELHQQLFYPPLDADKPLKEVLQGAAWVEFPEIRVMLKDEWEKKVQKGEVVIIGREETQYDGVAGVAERTRDSGWGAKRSGAPLTAGGAGAAVPAKKAKVDAGTSLLALGDYASDEDSDEEVGEEGQIEEGEDEGEDPSPEVMEAVGRALIADLGEA
ncbi:hypothetical protein L202_00336 [Cryptococcus amylolentus CBS 6039]|uniref:Box C/D snoRNA protein 1 n=1 Tax=Cryptococcus amylolentus CBS 6039 TaxID=1295533 RepID=A0A1E3I721_9TREE|nr:hypothetical protein L202_00336 [Cryptococcus amylolentus CBS 6039]ODN84372.1 hypothetical protein L202_00336 [Cryptococcus amylolentus CBS 6039]